MNLGYSERKKPLGMTKTGLENSEMELSTMQYSFAIAVIEDYSMKMLRY